MTATYRRWVYAWNIWAIFKIEADDKNYLLIYYIIIKREKKQKRQRP
jgi:hypothetical protein